MPNTPPTRPGRSLKERLEVARRMTAEQQRAARETPATSRRSKRDEAEQPEGTGKTASKSRRTANKDDKGASGTKKLTSSSKKASGPKARTASKEEIEEAKSRRKGLKFPSVSIGLGPKIAIGVVLVLVITLVMLYPVGQRYYQTTREAQWKEAVLAALEDREKAIEEENKELETDEGIENKARRDYGWTKEGESAAVVTNAGESSSGSSALPDQVDPSKIQAPSTWYYTILDVVFVYQPPVSNDDKETPNADSDEKDEGADEQADAKK